MNIVKKIKLLLLLSVFIISAKDVHAMDSDRLEGVASSSFSHHPPRLQAALPDFCFSPKPLAELEPNEDGVRKLILNATALHPSTEIDEQSRKELRITLGQITKKDILSRLEGIQQVFLLKLEAFSFLKSGGNPLYAKRGDIDPTLMKGMYGIVTKTLLLPKDEIIIRGVAIKKMVDILFYPLYKISGFDIARSINLINYAFGLTVDQINERTTTIKEYESYLVPKDDQTRPMVIESLFKDRFRSLLERVALMTAYEAEVRRTSFLSNCFNAEQALNQRKVFFSQLTLAELKQALAAKFNEPAR